MAACGITWVLMRGDLRGPPWRTMHRDPCVSATGHRAERDGTRTPAQGNPGTFCRRRLSLEPRENQRINKDSIWKKAKWWKWAKHICFDSHRIQWTWKQDIYSWCMKGTDFPFPVFCPAFLSCSYVMQNYLVICELLILNLRTLVMDRIVRLSSKFTGWSPNPQGDCVW